VFLHQHRYVDFRLSGSGIVSGDAAHQDRLVSSGSVLIDFRVKLIVDFSANDDDVRHGAPSCSYGASDGANRFCWLGSFWPGRAMPAHARAILLFLSKD
jgi:hypothetical protein